MKTRTLLLLFFVLLISVSSSMAQDDAPEIFTSGDWSYQENDDGITLVGYYGNEKNLEIPSEIDEKTVTQLGKELFLNNMTLETVAMPNTIAAIGANAFNGCTALKEVQLSNILKRIDTGTFRYCMNLEKINLPFSITVIGNFAFADCIQLKEMILLSITNIGESAFDNCQSLTNIIASNKLTTIGGHAFRDSAWLQQQTDEFVFLGKAILIQYNGTSPEVEIPYGTSAVMDAFEENYSLEYVTIPETVRTIGQYAFREALNLKTVEMGQYVTTIGASAFEGCRSLTGIELPAGIKTIAGSAFRYCENLKDISIPSSVTQIPANIFADCLSLKDVIIPASVTTIHAAAFTNDENLNLYVAYGSEAERYAQEKEIPYWYSMQQTEDFIYSLDENGAQIVRYVGKLYDVEVPAIINGARVTAIGTAAFQNNSAVRRVKLPITVKKIGDWAFSYMDSLEYVQIPAGLRSLGNNVFSGTTTLKEIKLQRNLTSIGMKPFDTDSQTKICARDNSEAAKLLTEMGYQLQPYDTCAEDSDTLALWAQYNSMVINSSSVCDCPCLDEQTPNKSGRAAVNADNYEILSIPDGIAVVTSDLVEGTGENLILIIPAEVTDIDPAILNGRNFMIISDAGTAAEVFAQENNLKFLVRINTLMNIQ